MRSERVDREKFRPKKNRSKKISIEKKNLDQKNFGRKKKVIDFFSIEKKISTKKIFDLEKNIFFDWIFFDLEKKISISKKFQTHFRDLRFLKFEILGPHFLKILRFLKFQTKIKKIVHIQISQDFFCDPGW